MIALIVCSRFSAWSNAMFASDSNTSSVTSEPVGHARRCCDVLADLGVGVVEGRQAVHELRVLVAGLVQRFPVDLVGLEQLDPLVPDLLGSPMDTHTSVCRKSDPGIASSGSSVSITLAPERSARSWAASCVSCDGHRSFGEQMRTSAPMIAP